jgi:hypothetical protein
MFYLVKGDDLMNKNIITLCLIFGLVILFFGGCESKTKKLEKKLKEEKSEQFFKDFMAQDHRERIALLSIKYNVEETTLEGILDEYLTKHDFSYGLTKSLGKKEKWDIYEKIDLNFKGTLSMLSSKYNLSKETLASIIIDYKSLKSKGASE